MVERLTTLVLEAGNLPLTYLLILLAFGAFALAAFAIHAGTRGRSK